MNVTTGDRCMAWIKKKKRGRRETEDLTKIHHPQIIMIILAGVPFLASLCSVGANLDILQFM